MIQKQFPPENLIQHCQGPSEEQKTSIETNEDLAYWAVDLEKALEKCNINKKSLRDWVEQSKGESK